MTLFGFFVFLDCDQINGSHFVKPLLQISNLRCHCFPIGGHTGGGHLLRTEGLNFRRPLVRDRNGDAFAADVVQPELVFLLNAFAEVLHGHILLRQLDFEGAALLLQFGQPAALFPQALFAGRDIVLLSGFLREQFSRLGIDHLALVLQSIDLPP